MPWYERKDFPRLLALAEDGHQMTSDYDVWHRQASTVAQDFLARGRALQIVTIRPEEFVAWLRVQGLPNIAANRVRYVETLAATTATPVTVAAPTEQSSVERA